MNTAEIRRAHDDLLARVAGLVDERPDVPAGSVLRAFSRSVRQLRQEGCPVDEMPARAERMTRETIGNRGRTASVALVEC